MAEHDFNASGNPPERERPPESNPESSGGSYGEPRKRISPAQADRIRALAREAGERDAADAASAEAIRRAAEAAGVDKEKATKKVKRVVVAQPEEIKSKGSFQGILDSATQKLTERSGFDDGPKKIGVGRLPENATPQQEFATLVSGLIVIVSTAANLPKEAQPTDEETNGIAYHISNIFIRHIPIKAGLSADVFDVLGIMAVLASWYSHAAPHINRNKKEPRPTWVTTDTRTTTPVDDISQVDPAVSDFLNPKKGRNGNER